MKKTLAIDCQVFQSDAWHRGMGKYSYQLIKTAFPELEKKYDDIFLVFNKNKLKPEVSSSMKRFTHKAKIIQLNLKGPDKGPVKKISVHNKEVLSAFFDTPDRDLDFLILSLFLDRSCSVFPDNARKYLLFYDIIPYQFYERYLGRINYDDYLANYKTIFEADRIFSISQTIADDLNLYLGIRQRKLTNIDGAHFEDEEVTMHRPANLPEAKFILMPTGDELRKNNRRGVEGFDSFNKKNSEEYYLVITSFFSEDTINDLNTISNKLIFTGNVPFPELRWLYEHAECVLFPCEYEGLGMPVLEAVRYGKKVACSDIPVFKEISENSFYWFDPYDPFEIATALQQLSDSEDWQLKEDTYSAIEKKYTWERTAEIFTEKITESAPDELTSVKNRPKLAVLCPSPDGFSAIGKVTAETHGALCDYFDVEYYFEKGPMHRVLRPDFLSSVATSYDVKEFNIEAYKAYDYVLYHIGNSEYHLNILTNALYLPGYIIFHDTQLGGAFNLLESQGLMSKDRLKAEIIVEEKLDIKNSHFLTALTNSQLGIFTHSKYAQKAVESVRRNSSITVKKLNLPADLPKVPATHKRSSVRVGLAGIIAGIKGLEIIESIAADKDFTNCDIEVFGYALGNKTDQAVGRFANVTLTTNLSDYTFQYKLSRLDVLLNYRMKYNGETSLTVIEAMRYGVVPVVRDIGWYSELPDDAVVKVKTVKEAIEAVKKLTTDHDLRAAYSLAAMSFVKNNHSHGSYVKGIYDLMTDPGYNPPNKDISEYLRSDNVSRAGLRRLIEKNSN